MLFFISKCFIFSLFVFCILHAGKGDDLECYECSAFNCDLGDQTKNPKVKCSNSKYFYYFKEKTEKYFKDGVDPQHTYTCFIHQYKTDYDPDGPTILTWKGCAPGKRSTPQGNLLSYCRFVKQLEGRENDYCEECETDRCNILGDGRGLELTCYECNDNGTRCNLKDLTNNPQVKCSHNKHFKRLLLYTKDHTHYFKNEYTYSPYSCLIVQHPVIDKSGKPFLETWMGCVPGRPTDPEGKKFGYCQFLQRSSKQKNPMCYECATNLCNTWPVQNELECYECSPEGINCNPYDNTKNPRVKCSRSSSYKIIVDFTRARYNKEITDNTFNCYYVKRADEGHTGLTYMGCAPGKRPDEYGKQMSFCEHEKTFPKLKDSFCVNCKRNLCNSLEKNFRSKSNKLEISVLWLTLYVLITLISDIIKTFTSLKI